MGLFSDAKMAELSAILRPVPLRDVAESSRITVHATVSRVAVLYEKIRNAVDYKDDHLLRKAAILRILKRQLVLEADARHIATNLIRELIAARYLANGALPDTLITDVAVVIRKWQVVRATRLEKSHERWLLGIVSAELEDLLVDRSQERALVHFLYEPLGDRVTIKDATMDEQERRRQVYIASWRVLFKVDDELLGYELVRASHCAWMRPDEWMQEPQAMALQMVGVEMMVRGWLHHVWAQKFQYSVKPWAVALGLVRRAAQEHPAGAEGLFQDATTFQTRIVSMAERRYLESSTKLRRGIVRAMIYLFMTKMLIAFAIEIPVETYLYKAFDVTALAINVLFPPVLMLFVGLLIRLPGKDNTDRLVQAAKELITPEGPKGREMKIPQARVGSAKLVFRVVYAATFVVVFGGVFSLLEKMHFTWVSSSIFILFLCLVSFFAFRLRVSARESVVVDRKDTLLNVLLDFFSLPILRVGQWLSSSISRINIFVFLFDFIIEAPLKLLLNVLEEWFAFMKEKKEEIQ
ncbi:MAG: hypothetical protein WCV84_01165 [Patescibacteria group bacterium]